MRRLGSAFLIVFVLSVFDGCSSTTSSDGRSMRVFKPESVPARVSTEQGSADSRGRLSRTASTGNDVTSNIIPSIPRLLSGEELAPTPEQSGEALESYMHEWFFGPGVGRTAVNVGTTIAFPPYALYLVGNAGLQLAGYKPFFISEQLPEPVGSGWLVVYDGVTSVPGLFNSLIFDEPFHGR